MISYGMGLTWMCMYSGHSSGKLRQKVLTSAVMNCPVDLEMMLLGSSLMVVKPAVLVKTLSG
jgi:hypothetical protein